MNAALVLEQRQKLDRRRLILAVLVGVLFHLWLFYFTFPEMAGMVYEGTKHTISIKRPPARPPKKEEPRVKPPPPKETEKPKAIIPVPDPTPDEPEAIQELEVEPAEIVDVPLDEDFVWGVPDAPDIPVGRRETEEDTRVYNPLEVSQEPQELVVVKPSYPELARQVRKEAVVILAIVVDKNGDVQSHKVLDATGDTFREQFIKEAVMAVYKYKFKPAIQSGHPVACTAKITINFRLE